jgi:hypothetical protein
VADKKPKIQRLVMINRLSLAGGPVYNIGETIGVSEDMATELLEGGYARLDGEAAKPSGQPSVAARAEVISSAPANRMVGGAEGKTPEGESS